MTQDYLSSEHKTLLKQAQMLHQAGNLRDAALEYEKLLQVLPAHPPLLAGLGSIQLHQGAYDQAALLLGKFLDLVPDHPHALTDQGAALLKLNRLEDAIVCYDKAIRVKPDLAEAYYNRGLARQNLQQFELAVANYDSAIALQADYVKAFNNRGLALLALGQLDSAMHNFQHAIALKPDYAEAYNNLGTVWLAQQHWEKALACFQQAVKLKPEYAQAHYNCGTALQQLKRSAQALASFQQSLTLQPGSTDALNNCGILLQEMQDYTAALAYFDQAIALEPDFAEAYINRGTALKNLDQLPGAAASYRQGLALNPQIADAYTNLGNILKDLKQMPEAAACFEQALALQADNATAMWNKALLQLLNGDYREGWQGFESRWLDPRQPQNQARLYPQPLWLGQTALAGKTLLIYPEQGLGDFIQFSRYIPKLAALSAQVVIEAPQALLSLLESLPGQFLIYAEGGLPPAFDYHCPVMSLPLAFQTTLATIPAQVPYLSANPQKLQFWQQRLGPKTRPRIGLVWSGSTIHKNDHKRSLPLSALSPLLALDYEFHVLQQESRAADEQTLATYSSLYRHALTDFTDTAALAAEMDLLISVDTSVAHLAGAMALPVWILLPYAPDFRWLLTRSDSPWYPSARLFRQPAPGDWRSVINSVVETLVKLRLSRGETA